MARISDPTPGRTHPLTEVVGVPCGDSLCTGTTYKGRGLLASGAVVCRCHPDTKGQREDERSREVRLMSDRSGEGGLAPHALRSIVLALAAV